MLTESQLRVQEEVLVLPIVREALPLPGGELCEVIELRRRRSNQTCTVVCPVLWCRVSLQLAWGAWNS